MEYFVNCNTAPLSPYTTPLNKTQVQHLYRRAGFGLSLPDLDQAVGSTANSLLHDATIPLLLVR